ncbi:MAG: hypothetical protein WC955_12665 [Elusimicrobiota bacterium]
MMKKSDYIRCTLITAYFFLSLGGLLLHMRIHPVSKDIENFIPAICGVLSTVVLPLMFWYVKTVPYAYIINGMTVIIGIITMAHFSAVRFVPPIGLYDILVGSTLADIVILLGKFAVGKAVYDLTLSASSMDQPRKVNTLRFLNMGWWVIHLALMSLAYVLGRILWK